MASCLADTSTVKGWVKKLREVPGLRVDEKDAGTVKVYDGEVAVYSAIQKGIAQPWIVITKDGETVKWK